MKIKRLKPGPTGNPIRLKKKIGGWNEMEFDAEIYRHGIRWLRVKDGFGQRGDREDWIGEIPSGTLSVSNYNWNEAGFGKNYGSFDKATAAAIKDEREIVLDGIAKTEKRLRLERQTLSILESLVSRL